tara:strand:+ start:537 stop:1262 length:726 start_codon:yes stop_codon:yes gene_type:complete
MSNNISKIFDLRNSFKGKRVLITGSTRGIGKNIAENFNRLGAEIIGFGSKDFDLTNEDEIKKFQKYITSLKKIDILINNAGINFSQEIDKIDEKKLKKLITINLYAPFLITKTVSKLMKNYKYGRIVNIASIAANRVRRGRSAYSASKHAIIGFTKTISIELAKYNILVNAVSPGFINTDMTQTMLSKKEIKILSNQVPLKKLGNVCDISNAVIFLTSDLNQFITGHELVVDGGFLNSIKV